MLLPIVLRRTRPTIPDSVSTRRASFPAGKVAGIAAGSTLEDLVMRTGWILPIALIVLGLGASAAQAQCCGATYTADAAPACSTGGCGTSCSSCSSGGSSCSDSCSSCTTYYGAYPYYASDGYYPGYASYSYAPSYAGYGWGNSYAFRSGYGGGWR